MAYFRQLGVIGVLGACFFVAAGCGDDDDKTNDGDAGEGGESAGKGGKSQGGSSAGKGGKSTAGSAGSGTAGSGTAGSAGSAGTPSQGGEAGEGGSGGSAGEPPVGGGEGGGGTSTGGAGAGAGGDAGAGGNPPTLTSCANTCEIDADCAIGEDTSFFCDEATHHCVAPNAECTTNEDCVPAVSLWDPCGLDNACPDDYVCIDWQGAGRCAPLPFVLDEDGAGGAPGTIDCFGDELRTLSLFGQQGEQEICVTTNARCGSAGVCFNGCGVFPEFACGFSGAVCDIPSGLCSCAAPAECPSIDYANAPAVCE